MKTVKVSLNNKRRGFRRKGVRYKGVYLLAADDICPIGACDASQASTILLYQSAPLVKTSYPAVGASQGVFTSIRPRGRQACLIIPPLIRLGKNGSV